MGKIDTSSWKKFKISEILQRVETAKLSYRISEMSKVATVECPLPAIAAGSANQGVACYIPSDGATILHNMISVAANGDGYAFYHPDKFTILQDAYALARVDGEPFMEAIALFIVAELQRILDQVFGWTNKSSWNKLKEYEILLPVTTKEVPDWAYMQERIAELEQERIAELEQERIAELEQYLIATGLNDYMLTDEDLKTLSFSGFRGDEAGNCTAAPGVRKEMRAFRVGSLFSKVKSEFYGKPNSYVSRKAYTTTEPDAMHTIPLTCAKMGDNGIMYYGETGMFSAEPNCLAMIRDGAVSTGLVYAQEQPTGVLSHSYLMKCKVDVAFETLLYCASVLTKALYPLYTRDNPSLWDGKVENNVVPLPIQTDSAGQPVIDETKAYHPEGFVPDWEYMAAYIRAIEKLVIKDVVDYKDAFIANTKAVVAAKSEVSS